VGFSYYRAEPVSWTHFSGGRGQPGSDARRHARAEGGVTSNQDRRDSGPRRDRSEGKTGRRVARHGERIAPGLADTIGERPSFDEWQGGDDDGGDNDDDD